MSDVQEDGFELIAALGTQKERRMEAPGDADSVADSVVGEGQPYLPIRIFRNQATSYMVYGMRVGGPIGSLLRVASHALDIAVEHYVREYGEFDDGPPPPYELT